MGLASTSVEDTDSISPYPNEGTIAQLVCSGLAHVCCHSILSLVEILFSVVLNLLSYITFPPKVKENIIQTKYTFEPQHVRRQLGSVTFEIREIYECKERHQINIVLDVQNPCNFIQPVHCIISLLN